MADTQSGQRRILVAAEAPWEREDLERVLQGAGYEVVVAHNGLGALDEIHRTQPDAVVITTMMPRVDGIEVLRRLKASPTTAQLPVILLTPKVAEVGANRWIQARIEELGGTGLLKPVEADELVEVIRRLLHD
jgi:CheY-like chemotaxis protein